MRKWLLPLLLCTACSVGLEYEKPAFDLPGTWPWEQGPTDTAALSKVDIAWWEQFQDPVLNDLITEARKNNADILTAAARVSEARAILSFQRANQLPLLEVQGSAVRTGNSEEALTGLVASTGAKPYNTFSIAGVLSYEIDLWCRLANASASARAQLLSVEANRDAIRLAVLSDTARGYFALRSLDAQLQIAEETLTSRDDSYAYRGKQFKAGAISELDLRQAESELATAKASIAQLKQARDQQANALSVLLGRSPKALVESAPERGKSLTDITVPPILPQELPSSLLERRPDIRAAEQALIASNTDIGVARADYFPTISLSALLGLSSREADDLLSSSARYWQAGGGLAGPLIDFGRTTANVEAADSRNEQANITYAQAVRVAFQDVMNAMSAQDNSEDYLLALQERVAALRESLRLANLRYDAGYSDYLEVLDAQRSLFSAQLDEADAARARLAAAVDMMQALGGGWDVTETSAPADTLKDDNVVDDDAVPETENPAK